MNVAPAAAFFRTGVALLPLIACSLLGCGGERKQHQVAGVVEFDGKPLPAGNIYFDPMPGNADASQGFASVKNGRFSTATPGGRGVGSGKYLVRIVGFDGQATDQSPEGTLLFDRFEVPNVSLPEADSEQYFEVPARK